MSNTPNVRYWGSTRPARLLLGAFDRLLAEPRVHRRVRGGLGRFEGRSAPRGTTTRVLTRRTRRVQAGATYRVLNGASPRPSTPTPHASALKAIADPLGASSSRSSARSACAAPETVGLSPAPVSHRLRSFVDVGPLAHDTPTPRGPRCPPGARKRVDREAEPMGSRPIRGLARGLLTGDIPTLWTIGGGPCWTADFGAPRCG